MTVYRDRPTVTDEALNAYVDGALPQEDAAYVADAAARVPGIAERIAMLHQLKASVAGMADDVVLIDLPPVAVVASKRPVRGIGLAAMAVASVVAMAVFVPGDPGVAPETAASAEVAAGVGVSAFVAAHDGWLAGQRPDLRLQHDAAWLRDIMQATGLVMVHHAQAPAFAGTTGQHSGFVGPNGCRLSLFEVMSPETIAEGLDVSIRDGLLVARWAEPGRGYALVARTMNHGRFMVIAAALHDGSRQRDPLDAVVLAGLEQARQPCLG